MNEIQIFNNPEFGEMRTILSNDNKMYFCGKDVATALGYKQPDKSIRDRVRDKDREKFPTPTINGGMQEMTYINESGLYRLIFGSQLPSAERFQDWVFDEVLPTLNRTGTYSMPQTPDEKIQLIAQGYVEMKKDVDTVKGEVSTVKSEIKTLKDELPIFLNEAQQLTDAVKKKGVEAMGGKDSESYYDKSIRTSVYFDIYNVLYREFGISSYKALKRNQLNSALEIIKQYKLPIILRDKIELTNAQGRLAL